MCYFVEINLSRQELEKRFNVPALHDPRYMQSNLLSAFTKPFLPAIPQEDPGAIRYFQWGLIPGWVKDRQTADKISLSTFNARAEGIFEKASFRSSARHKRCMVCVHGFFEWHHTERDKIPYYIKRKDNRAFALAGLYESWTDRQTGEIIDTISIITTRANPMLEKIHNSKKRMPVILDEKDEIHWIDPSKNRPDLESFFKPFDENKLRAYPVNKHLFLRHENPLDPGILKEFHAKPEGDQFSLF